VLQWITMYAGGCKVLSGKAYRSRQRCEPSGAGRNFELLCSVELLTLRPCGCVDGTGVGTTCDREVLAEAIAT
jgi:hypothetical protein